MLSNEIKLRNDKIRCVIEARTKELTKSPQTARDWLIGIGIYDNEGNLTPEFGGNSLNSAEKT